MLKKLRNVQKSLKMMQIFSKNAQNLILGQSENPVGGFRRSV